MIKKEKITKDNIVKFPSKLTDLEKEIEAVIFAAAEPLDIDTIESKITKKGSVVKSLEKDLVTLPFFVILLSIVSISNGSAAAKITASISFSKSVNLDGNFKMLSLATLSFLIIIFLYINIIKQFILFHS